MLVPPACVHSIIVWHDSVFSLGIGICPVFPLFTLKRVVLPVFSLSLYIFFLSFSSRRQVDRGGERFPEADQVRVHHRALREVEDAEGDDAPRHRVSRR